MTSRVQFIAWISVDDAVALFADVAGRVLLLGRPAALVRERFDKTYDHNSVGSIITGDWPATAAYAGDGAAVAVDVYTIEESGNPRDGWVYAVRAVLTLPQPRGGRVILDDTTGSPRQCRLALDIDDDRDGSLFEAVHELARLRAGVDAEDASKRSVR